MAGPNYRYAFIAVGIWMIGVLIGMFFFRVLPSFPYLCYATVIGGVVLGFRYARKV